MEEIRKVQGRTVTDKDIKTIQPIQIKQVKTQEQAELFRSLLSHFHYSRVQ